MVPSPKNQNPIEGRIVRYSMSILIWISELIAIFLWITGENLVLLSALIDAVINLILKINKLISVIKSLFTRKK